jgi:mannitol-specific phosphotransferase system IIBC component
MTKLPKNEGGKAVRCTFFLLVVTTMMVSMVVASLPVLAQEKTDCAQYAKNVQQKMSEDKSKDVAKLLAEEPTGCLRTTAERSGGFCNTLLNYSASHPDLFRTRALASAISTPIEKCLQ